MEEYEVREKLKENSPGEHYLHEIGPSVWL